MISSYTELSHYDINLKYKNPIFGIHNCTKRNKIIQVWHYKHINFCLLGANHLIPGRGAMGFCEKKMVQENK